MEVVFTCVHGEHDCSVLGRTPLSGRDIDRVLFFQSHSIGMQVSPQTSQGTVLTFRLISKSPLTFTMTTIASTDLSGATISYHDGIPGSLHYNDTLMVEIVSGNYLE